jgi:hypothetical protein
MVDKEGLGDDGSILLELISDLSSSVTDTAPSQKRNALLNEATRLISEQPTSRRVLARRSSGRSHRLLP